jgi:glycosyltransferase involved in cell wall biosynthesis
MKVLMLTRYSRMGASSRLRSFQYLPWLAEAGMTVHTQSLFDDAYLRRLYAEGRTAWGRVLAGYLERLACLFEARQYDLLILEKELFPWLPALGERLLQGLRVPFVVDYDDAIFHQYELSRNPLKRLLATKIDRVMAAASVVVCGNDYLADRARAAGARQVATIPTSVNLNRYPLRLPRPSTVVRVGWIGTPRTVHYLEMLTPALKQLAGELPLRLVVVGAEFKVAGLAVQCLPWTEESEADAISEFDIGVMPLADSPWERGKCAYKLIQTMACGRPVIGSRVGANCSVLEHGSNGYLASDDGQWRQAIEALAQDPNLRLELGLAGRRTVQERYSLHISGPLYTQLCLQAAGRQSQSVSVGEANPRPRRAR